MCLIYFWFLSLLGQRIYCCQFSIFVITYISPVYFVYQNFYFAINQLLEIIFKISCLFSMQVIQKYKSHMLIGSQLGNRSSNTCFYSQPIFHPTRDPTQFNSYPLPYLCYTITGVCGFTRESLPSVNSWDSKDLGRSKNLRQGFLNLISLTIVNKPEWEIDLKLGGDI